MAWASTSRGQNFEPVERTSRAHPSNGSTFMLEDIKGKRRADPDFVNGADVHFLTESSASPASLAEDSRRKRRKASRACSACQRAHLTCDDGRPCERCIKRGCADSCQDGKRKKAKYLRDIDDELVELRHNPPGLEHTSTPPSIVLSDAPILSTPLDAPSSSLEEAAPFDSYLNSPERRDPAPLPVPAFDGLNPLDDPNFFNFDSEGANLEYSILSSMLSNTGYEISPAEREGLLSPAFANLSSFESTPVGDPGSAQTAGLGPAVREKPSITGDGTSTALATAAPSLSFASRSIASPGNSHAAGHDLMKGDEVYTTVTAPYPYAHSYHDLMRHLKEKFDRADIVRVIRALALFRPSLIALQMPLSEEDEIFVEKCFQRTLIEYEKLVTLSGTPTVVWRRTCEICLVGEEFCELSRWKRQDLIGRKRYVFELFDNASVVRYYESMAAHAFENTTGTVTMNCNLLTPDGQLVPCVFCFSIKRDLFSIPSLIIGQFMPRIMDGS